MFMKPRWEAALIFSVALLLSCGVLRAEIFRIATYNVENYLDRPTESRPHIKSAAARAKVRESLSAIRPDVLALQEIGGAGVLLELQNSLKAEGLVLPYSELVYGCDTNIQVALLSRFPISARRPHTNECFLLSGRRVRVSRGFAEVDIRVSARLAFTLINAHLKSRRPVVMADESEQRFEESRVLRRLINARLAANPAARLVVLGDFNDTRDSPTLREILGDGRGRLLDTRPAERNGDTASWGGPRLEPRRVVWTEYYAPEDSYCRIDYILLSAGMVRDWVPAETYVLALPDWGLGSDHRPLVAGFVLN